MRRVPATHRGSVLIAVVGVLMLLAILAAVFLATARQDRIATGQHAANTQADLLLDGLISGVKAGLTRDANASFDAPGFTPWLASRTPVTLDPNNVFSANAANDTGPNRAAWPAVSAPVLGDTTYETPFRLPSQPSARFTITGPAVPTFATYAGVDVPALSVNTAAPGRPAEYHTVPAADADGDGIADAALFRLPVGELNGISYFGAVRVIDNNAAVHLDTALSRDNDFDAAGNAISMATNPLTGAFTGHVGLAELLRSPAELKALNESRWHLPPAATPDGVAGNPDGTFVYDDTRLASGDAGPRGAVAAKRPELLLASIADFAQSRLGRRPARPGITRGTDHARSAFSDSLSLAARFAVAPPDADNRLTTTVAASLNTGGNRAVPARPYNRNDGIDAWFTTHFDTLAEDPADPSTFRARRTIVTGTNGVSSAAAAAVAPPAFLYKPDAPEWASRTVAAYPPVYTPLDAAAPVPTLPMETPSDHGTKASINTARFESLFSAYFKVMARPGFDGRANDKGTPFGDASPPPADPYAGTRFAPATPTDPADAADVAADHPQRMFRSPLRPPRAGSTWDNAPRLPADQVLLLRAALAAANLEALRDSSHAPAFVNAADNTNAGSGNDRTAEHRVPLTAIVNGNPTPIVARVYGLRRQPFIVEVYANTLAGRDGATPPAPPATVNPNPKGYVAIKIYNPTSVPISLQHCRLVGLRRSRPTAYDAAAPGEYPAMTVRPLAVLQPGNAANTDQLDLGSPSVASNVLGPIYGPTIVPAFGTLVLENLPAAGVPSAATAAEDATYRPTSSGLVNAAGDNAGPVTPVDFLTQNVAYVPGLSRVVWDRDLVLMRPPNCRPPSPDGTPANTITYAPTDPDAPPATTVAGMVPLDGYDFTGLAPYHDAAYTPVRTRAEIWHYVRGIAPALAQSGNWQFVYPGRYDGNAAADAPRQQGTVRAVGSDGQFGWDPTLAADKDPLAERPIAGVTVSLGLPPAAGTVAGYPDAFTLRLNPFDAPGRQPLHDYLTAGGASPNVFPFGGLTRLGGLLDVPFVGSYTLQTEADTAAGRDVFLEVTPVTMDSVFAEDTDVTNNPRPGDNAAQSREQLGRFVPVRGVDDAAAPGNRYAFAKTLFDHFTVHAPDDDYTPDYPTQPSWRPRTAYAVGDVVQYGQHLFVCRTAHTSGPGDAASQGAPDYLDAGVAAQPPAVPYATPPVASVNWLPLPRYPLANGAGPAGSRSDLKSVATGNPRPYDYFTDNDDNERGVLTAGLINLNTASEKVLGMLPWSSGDRLTVRFESWPPTVAAGGDGIDDNVQIAHAIVLYRDGRTVASKTAAANALGIGVSTATWPAATTPFGSLFDLYAVPGLTEAQAALLSQPGSDPGTHDRTRSDYAAQTALIDRVSGLVTTRSDSFTVYAELQGWRGVGTDRPALVVRRRAAGIYERDADKITATRVPTD